MTDLTGQRFGMLTVVGPRRDSSWTVRCDCGTEKLVRGTNLRSGNTGSCGCKHARKEAPCQGPKCDRTAKVKGLCDTHYQQQRQGRELIPVGSTVRGAQPRATGAPPPRDRVLSPLERAYELRDQPFERSKARKSQRSQAERSLTGARVTTPNGTVGRINAVWTDEDDQRWASVRIHDYALLHLRVCT
jgi:hypothetical protein